jgi:antitoxin HicB
MMSGAFFHEMGRAFSSATSRCLSLTMRTKNGTSTRDVRLKRLPARFYRSDSGREPVREWLKSLEPEDRKNIGEDIKDIEFSWPIGMPLVRSLGRELWEVRSRLRGGRIARIIFCVEHESMLPAASRFYQEVPKDSVTRPRIGAQAQKRIWYVKKKNMGSSFDSWLREEGIYEEVTAAAIKRVLARQLEAAMKEKRFSKAEMARRMRTSRSALDRLLDPEYDAVTLSTLRKAAIAVGRQLRLELV